MNTYTLDHSGSCQSESGVTYHFLAGVPIELPDDVAKALGIYGKQAKKEQPKEEVKEVAEAPKDKMVKKTKVVTK